jgi:hypothetical protein
LVPPFEKQLKRRYDAGEASPAVAQSVRPRPALQPNLLANGREG